MKRVKMKKGFTIVETLLVLSISSLFAVGMMAGWSANIERQRYNDTINTLKSDIQNVFNEVENPTNTRGLNITCENKGGDEVVVGATISSKQNGNRGASKCVILGKLISFEKNNSELKVVENKGKMYVYDVIGLDIDTAKDCRGVCLTHKDAFVASKYTVISFQNQEVDVQWSNSYIPFIKDDTNAALTGVLIMRSPMDGTVKVYSYRSRSEISKADKIGDDMQLNDTRKVGMCVRKSLGGTTEGSSPSPFGKNRVVRIGNSSASVEIATLDGDGSSWCDDAGVGNVRIQ